MFCCIWVLFYDFSFNLSHSNSIRLKSGDCDGQIIIRKTFFPNLPNNAYIDYVLGQYSAERWNSGQLDWSPDMANILNNKYMHLF